MSLIDTTKSGNEKLSSKPSWMFDSEASTYMTADEGLIVNYENIRPILIDLLNNT